MKIAIVATFARALPVLATWVQQHRELGITHFYVFADRPEEEAAALALNLEGVTLQARGPALQQQWQALDSWPMYQAFAETQVYARQILNADLAIAQARRDGCDWLLHIDLDELLYADHPNTSLPHYLAANTDADQLCFVNHEAVPQAWHVGNYFEEITLFKRSTIGMAPAQQAHAYRAFGQQYFLAYGNGKSAINLHGRCTRAHGVHQFFGGTLQRQALGFCVLHYSQCGFNWYADKYLTLGAFDENLIGNAKITDAFPFMGASRSAFVSGDMHAATQLYQTHLMQQGGLPHSLTSLLEAGVLFYNRQPVFVSL